MTIGRNRLLLYSAALVLSALAVEAAAQPRLEVYVRTDCPHCAAAEAYLKTLQAERPDLEIVLYAVDRDPAARARLFELSEAAGHWPPGVPTFVVGDDLLVGFDRPATTGPAIRDLIDGGGPPGDRAMSVTTRWFGEVSVSRLGLPGFALMIGLLDGFNPCAMWVLLFLLSMLVHLHDRRRMFTIAATFVLVSGAVYYAFMAAWLNLFLAIGFGAAVRFTLAVVAFAIGAINVKDFFAFRQGVSLSIPDEARPGIYARLRAVLQSQGLLASLMGVAALAVLVNFVELLCTAGLPAVFTAVLAQHDLGNAGYYGYLGIYIVGYIADDSLMVGAAVMTLSQQRLTERAGRWLKLVSGAVMLVLGLLLLLRPEWLF